MIKLILPFPPSVNHLFAQNKQNAKLRFKTKKYKDWIEECEKIKIDEKAEGECTISYKIFFPDDRIRDGQNYIKAPLDFLVQHGVIKEDNRRIVKGEQWIDGGIDRKNPRVEITIKEFQKNI